MGEQGQDVKLLSDENAELRRRLDRALARLEILEAAVGMRPVAELSSYEQLLCDLIDDMPAGVAIIDRLGTILITNRAWDQFAIENGIPQSEAVGRGINYLEACRRAVGPRSEEARECLEKLQALLDGELDQFDIEYPCHSPDQRRWFVLHAAAFHHECYYALLSHIDITKSKLAELELRQSQQMLQLVLDTIPVRVFWKDRYSRYLGCNKLVAQDAGLSSPDELVGKTDFDFIWREQAEIYRADDREVMGTGQSKLNYEEPQRTKEGGLIWLRTSKVPLRDPQGEVIGVLGTFEDITKRKQVEEELHRRILMLTLPESDLSSLRFEDLFNIDEIQKIQDAFAEATGVASVITDLQGRPITQPSNFCRLCREFIRQTPKGLANCMKSDAVLGRLNPAGPIIRTCLSGGLLDGGTSICVGDRHIANWLIGQVLDDSIDTEAILAYGREIGVDPEEYRRALCEVTRMPREQFEKVCRALCLIARQLSQLALQNVQQARAITERQRAEAALREADQRKDEFLAMLSHELRNPLAPIRNAVLILQNYCDASCARNEKTQRQREIIDRQVAHMARLLDDLLDVSRITRGKIRLKRERIDLREIMARALDTVRPQSAGRGQTIFYEPPDESYWVDGDPTRMEQVLCNLMHNAVKYSNDGGRIWVELAADAGTGEAVIEVRDEGIGITPEMLPRIFEIFTQASQSLDRAQGGLGIGLTLVQKLMELHGGSISAASAGLGQGSTFAARLPLTTGVVRGTMGAGAKPACRALSVLPAGEHPRVLVVDDILDTATSMADVLRIWGYLVSIACDGPRALELAKSFDPEIVILDIGLPGMDGYEVARRLRDEAGLERARLIAVTGYGSEEDRQRALAAGFNHHFAKPVDMGLLQHVLERESELTFEI